MASDEHQRALAELTTQTMNMLRRENHIDNSKIELAPQDIQQLGLTERPFDSFLKREQ